MGRVTTSMRVVIATPLYPPESGGPATYAKLLAEGLPAKGIEVEVVAFGDVRHLPKLIRHAVYFRRVWAAARVADLVLALDPVSVGLPACLAARSAGKPFVVKIVGDYAWEQGRQRCGVTETLDDFVKNANVPHRVRLWRTIETRVAHCASRIITPSEYLKSIIVAWGIPQEKIEVIYNAVSVEHLGAVPEAVKKMQKPLVVTAARLVAWKGIDGLLRAFDGLWATRKEGSTASLVIVGTGPQEQELKAYAQTLKIKDHCLFTGELSHEQTLAVIREADVFVLNSSYEGLSHVLIEALRLGKCIVATTAGGNPEVVVSGAGMLINVGDETRLSASLRTLIEHKEERDCYALAARKSSDRFLLDTMLTRTATLLTSL